MGMIRIEGDKETRLSREGYDLRRKPGSSGQTVCHAPFVSLDLRGSGTVAPCRYSSIDLGRILDQSLEEIWQGQRLIELRQRFRDYRVKGSECRACVECWVGGIPTESPAIAEFDELPLPEEDCPQAPRMLGLDLRTPLPPETSETVFGWLPELARLEMTLLWPPSDPFFSADRILHGRNGSSTNSSPRGTSLTLSFS